MSKRWFVYVLINPRNETYTGVTFDETPDRRLIEHNGKKTGGAKFTRARGPWKLLYAETGFESRSTAQAREWQIKKDAAFKKKLKG